MAKLILYIFFVPLIVISMDSVNINGIFKKGQSNYYQAIWYLILLLMF